VPGGAGGDRGGCQRGLDERQLRPHPAQQRLAIARLPLPHGPLRTGHGILWHSQLSVLPGAWRSRSLPQQPQRGQRHPLPQQWHAAGGFAALSGFWIQPANPIAPSSARCLPCFPPACLP
jgi:hypothetical protein